VRPLLDRPFELSHGRVGVDQRDVRRREDPIAVVERPVVVHPLVERVEHGMRRGRVVQQRLFDADTQRREQEAAFHPLRVHQREARDRIAVRVADRLELAECGADVVTGALAAEIVVERAGTRDGVERRVGNEAEHTARDHHAFLAVDRRPLHGLAVRGRKVASERVDRFVVVVVRVEDVEFDPLAHAASTSVCARPVMPST
jgi:hypothetical protein